MGVNKEHPMSFLHRESMVKCGAHPSQTHPMTKGFQILKYQDKVSVELIAVYNIITCSLLSKKFKVAWIFTPCVLELIKKARYVEFHSIMWVTSTPK